MSRDWTRFFTTKSVIWAEIAGSRKNRGLVCADITGQRQLYGWDVDSNHLRQLTSAAHGVSVGSIDPDGGYVYWPDDPDGREFGHIVRVRWDGGDVQRVDRQAEAFAVASYLLLDVTTTSVAFIVSEEGDSRVEVVTVGPDGSVGDQRTAWRSHGLVSQALCSPDGALLATSHTVRTHGLHQSTTVVDAVSGRTIADFFDGSDTTVSPKMWSPTPGDSRLLAVTTQSGRELPILLSPLTGDRRSLAVEDIEGSVLPMEWSPDLNAVLLLQMHRAITRLHVYDLDTEQHRAVALHGSVNPRLRRPAWFAGDRIWAVTTDSIKPARIVECDLGAASEDRTILAVDAGVANAHPWRSIEFDSGGDNVQAWLATPEGSGPWPTVIETHGGPVAVEVDSYWPEAQAWVDNGFAYCSVNYHGSTTFGDKFRDSIVGNPGQLEVDDIVAAREWLVDHSVARQEHVLLTGWSYGGYLTLQAIGSRPALWAGGVALIAIADWEGMVGDDVTPPLRTYAQLLLGGARGERPDVYRSASPITYAEQVRAPLLIIQGRGDTRCPAAQLERYVGRLEALGRDVEVIWFDAGHQGGSRDDRIAWMTASLGFAARVVGSSS
jgi:dipeptidyl aminopeptidase/acylaminoacyl peptidase